MLCSCLVQVQISNISLSKLGLGINVDFSVGLKKKKNSNNMNKEIGKYHKNSVMNDSKMKKWRRRNEDKNPFDSSEPSFSEFVTRKKKTNYRNNRMTSSLAAKKTKKSKMDVVHLQLAPSRQMKRHRWMYIYNWRPPGN